MRTAGKRQGSRRLGTHLLPFCPSGKKRDNCFRDSSSPCDDGGVLDELVCPELKEKKRTDKSSDVVGDLGAKHGGLQLIM